MSLRIRRGTEQERIGRTFDQGEIIWTTNGEKLYVGDGVTPGGKNIAAQLAGTNLAFNSTTGTLGVTGLTTDLVTEGLNNKYFSAEAAQDAIGAAIAAGSQSGISVVYNDNGTDPASINFTVTGGGGGGLSDIVLDTSPSLGGNLDLNGRNVFGTGSIDIDGNFEVTGAIVGSTLAVSTGLATELILNGNDISGTGDVRINGNFTGTNVSVTGTISATNGLGANLDLNSRDITGFGGINIIGDIGATNVTVSTIAADSTITGDSLNTSLLTISGNTIESSGGTLVLNPDTTLTCFQDTTGNFINLTGLVSAEAWININNSRGSIDTPSPVQNGDILSGVMLFGYDGTTQSRAVTIGARVDGTISAGIVPGEFLAIVQSTVVDENHILSFNSAGKLTVPKAYVGDGTAGSPSIGFTTDGSQDSGFFHPGDGIICTSINGIEKVRVDSGGIRVVGFAKVGGFATGSLPSPAEAGMIVLDTDTNQFKGYNGSGWVVLG